MAGYKVAHRECAGTCRDCESMVEYVSEEVVGEWEIIEEKEYYECSGCGNVDGDTPDWLVEINEDSE